VNAKRSPPPNHRRSGISRLGPIKVLVLDAEHLPEAVSAARPAGGRYVGLWALVRKNGRPTALLKFPFGEGPLTREDLAMRIAQVGDVSPNGAVTELQFSPPPISVIVPTMFKRLDSLRLTLKSLEDLDYPTYEVLLVDNRPDGPDAPPAWLDRFPAIRVLTERRPGISAARNRGLAVATGDLIAFTRVVACVSPTIRGTSRGGMHHRVHPSSRA
jgi:Glycosyl transferase family 2